MPFLSTIVASINSSLQNGSLATITPADYKGIATVLARKKDAKTPLELMPATMSLQGEYSLVEPKNEFGIIIYHKVLSNNYSLDKSSYGEVYGYKSATDMALIVFSDTKNTGRTVEEIEQLIIVGMPNKLPHEVMSSTGLANCMITPVSSTMDKLNVFRGEYPGSEFFLKPTNQLFSVRYRIETTFDKSCIIG